MFKRIMLFILTNVLVITTISIIFSIFGIQGYIREEGGIDFTALLIFSAIIGFTGALISLAMSRWMAKKAMNVQVLNPDGPLNDYERRIVETVHRISRTAGLTDMPEVGIYHSPEVNAFATGPTKKRSLVALSTGLLEQMDDAAVEGVIAHEIAHIANGDMVTMTLLQGVINTFVVFLSRIAAYIVSNLVKSDSMRHIVHFACIIVFQIVFSILGSLVVMAFSRYREYHADAGAAAYAGKDKMIHALQSLKRTINQVDTSQTSLNTMKISTTPKAMKLFSSHPDLDDRINRLSQS
ncbi:protease HtpX [Paenibacillus sp. 598K]|uniref:protease HtpX n=1 Tax=Paenibacillus sp. 598K TaxID=1117987 RepID=UPI000FFE35B0|nr:protease HtpX [Paenibacillus sp. 598K]